MSVERLSGPALVPLDDPLITLFILVTSKVYEKGSKEEGLLKLGLYLSVL